MVMDFFAIPIHLIMGIIYTWSAHYLRLINWSLPKKDKRTLFLSEVKKSHIRYRKSILPPSFLREHVLHFFHRGAFSISSELKSLLERGQFFRLLPSCRERTEKCGFFFPHSPRSLLTGQESEIFRRFAFPSLRRRKPNSWDVRPQRRRSRKRRARKSTPGRW